MVRLEEKRTPGCQQAMPAWLEGVGGGEEVEAQKDTEIEEGLPTPSAKGKTGPLLEMPEGRCMCVCHQVAEGRKKEQQRTKGPGGDLILPLGAAGQQIKAVQLFKLCTSKTC